MGMTSITKVTRLAIFDELRVRATRWWGRLREDEFLERLYNLDQLPSTDARHHTAREDIIQHTVRWSDWEPHWVFQDPRFQLMEDDALFVAFLAAMVHPMVRADADEARDLVNLVNQHLAADGWHLAEVSRISGRPVFEPRATGVAYVAPIPRTAEVFESAYVHRQISRMQEAVHGHPELAIGTAKEWLETTCKTVLAELGADIADGEMPGLVKSTLKALPPDMSGAADPKRPQNAIERLLGNLSGLGAAVAEVRNACGTGHGQHAGTGDLQPTYALLVVNATIAIVTYIVGRYESIMPSTAAATSTAPPMALPDVSYPSERGLEGTIEPVDLEVEKERESK